MHAGNTAYYPEKLLKTSHVIAAARAVARERTPFQLIRAGKSGNDSSRQ